MNDNNSRSWRKDSTASQTLFFSQLTDTKLFCQYYKSARNVVLHLLYIMYNLYSQSMYHVFDFQVYCDCAYAKSRKKRGMMQRCPCMYISDCMHVQLAACQACRVECADLVIMSACIRRRLRTIRVSFRFSKHTRKLMNIIATVQTLHYRVQAEKCAG